MTFRPKTVTAPGSSPSAQNYTPSKTVKAFMESNARYRAIVGPFGSGKSSGSVMEFPRRGAAQRRGVDGIRHTRFAVVRNTRPQLRDTTRKTFDSWLGTYGTWRENPMEFRIRRDDMDCEVLFRALDEPKDVRNLLSLELTGCYFNEVREISEEIWKGMSGRVGRFPATKDGGCSWAGVWADSNPWHTGHWADKLFTKGLKEHELYRQPSGLAPDAENLEHLELGYYDTICLGKSQDWIDLYVHGLNGAGDEGSVFGRWIETLRKRGGLEDFLHRTDDVFTSWDLGLADATAIFWWRVTPHGVEVLDWYENQGEGLEHYFEQLERRARPVSAGGLGFNYVKHWLPHDAANNTLAAGTSVLNRFLQRYPGKVSLNPNLSILDGIQAARWLLEQPGTRFHTRAADGLDLLAEYRYAWDDGGKCFSKQPVHNYASHTGDALRYMAVVARQTGLIMNKPRNTPPLIVGGIQLQIPSEKPLPYGSILPNGKLNVTFDQLCMASDRRRRR